MIETILGSLLPIVVTLVLGFVAGWHHDFDGTHATILNRMVMLYALPLTLFAAMVGITRDQVFSQGALAFAILIGMSGGYAVVFLVSYYFIRRDLMTASLRALAIAGPAVPFVGVSVLGSLFGSASAVPISVAALVLNLIQVPATLVLLSAGVDHNNAGSARESVAGNGAPTSMTLGTALLFAATVLPLICTPGPDMLFVTSQALSGGTTAGLRSTAGVCLGYVGHSILVALGVAAIIAASSALFEALRWFGVAYLIYLAFQLKTSAARKASLTLSTEPSRKQLRRGFLTAFLNPKGMMIYFAILPQFMDHTRPVGLQALVLSTIFVALCGVVYTILSVAIASIDKKGGFSDRRRRWVEGTAGCLLIVAAGRLAAN